MQPVKYAFYWFLLSSNSQPDDFRQKHPPDWLKQHKWISVRSHLLGGGGDCSNEPLQRLLEPGELGGTDRIRTGNQCRLAVNIRVRSSSASRPNLSLAA